MSSSDRLTRRERDALGERDVPVDALYGIHTARAIENFPLAGRPVHRLLVRGYGAVKQACAQVNQRLGVWADDPAKGDAIVRAAAEVAAGDHAAQVLVDALQGGAGTSTNMNVNEVIANRALALLGEPYGNYARISPLDDVNRHQSTNDTFPTALRVAGLWSLARLETAVVALQEAFQEHERRFSHVVKVGRTEFQDAVLVTLGREMGAYAEALARDRWRIYKCSERLRVVPLGGTAIGTGLGAPRQYIFEVVDELRALTGLGLARAENLVDAVQNADVFAEVSGILRAAAVNLLKISSDLRLLSSGPQAGLGEITLPPRQAGSSIMPGKVNPVIPEAVSQAAMQVMGLDAVIAQAAAAGSLELNPFLPLIADNLLGSLDLLASSAEILRAFCVAGIGANEDRCQSHVDASTATATALVARLGYQRASALAAEAAAQGRPLREVVVGGGHLTEAEYDELTSPEAVCRLGSPPPHGSAT
jgi:aspartate ammonia-lyase